MVTLLLFLMTTPAPGASLDVYADQRADRPIDRRLFGKFTEHLGRNVYGGLWAQILQNPGFEPDDVFGHTDGIRTWVSGVLRPSHGPIRPEALRAIPLWWGPFGAGDFTAALDAKAFNSRGRLKLEVRALRTGLVGVAQPLYLPVHRVRRFELSLAARGSAPSGITMQLLRADGERELLCTAQIENISDEWTKHAASLEVPAGALQAGELAILALGLAGPGTVYLDQAFLFPADHVDGFDPDVIRYLKEARLPILRWPGGNFVSGYHWENGIGPVDQRPTLKNPAWPISEPNHVGTDEFMTFCRHVGCEPMICLNAGDGTPEEAARWVQYCNGGPNTEQGRRRAANGHPEPYGVEYWEIGNELYGSWQVGHCNAEEYARRYRAFYQAMTNVDPGIRFIANGHDEAWNGTLIRVDADILRSISVHLLTGGGIPADADPRRAYLAWMGYVHRVPRHLLRLGRQMRDGGVEPMLAITELQIMTHRGHLPRNYTQSEALLTAGVINTGIRADGRIELITHSALVNHGGGLKKDREIVYPDPVHWVHYMYGNQPGRWPVRLDTQCETFHTEAFHGLPAAQEVPYLDAVALADDDDRALCLLVTNRHPDQPLETVIRLHGFSAATPARVQTLAGDSFLAANSWDHPDNVKIEESPLQVPGDELTYTFPPHSVNCILLRRR